MLLVAIVSQAVLQGAAFRRMQVFFKLEKAHFAARKKGPENRKHEVKSHPFLCRPLKHSMSIARVFFRAFLGGGGGISHDCVARYVAADVPAWKGVSHHFGDLLTSLKKFSRDMGLRSDSIAMSRDMGPLSS